MPVNAVIARYVRVRSAMRSIRTWVRAGPPVRRSNMTSISTYSPSRILRPALAIAFSVEGRRKSVEAERSSVSFAVSRHATAARLAAISRNALDESVSTDESDGKAQAGKDVRRKTRPGHRRALDASSRTSARPCTFAAHRCCRSKSRFVVETDAAFSHARGNTRIAQAESTVARFHRVHSGECLESSVETPASRRATAAVHSQFLTRATSSRNGALAAGLAWILLH